MNYTYSLHPVERPENAIYTEEELQQLTTLQLREVLRKEKIVFDKSKRLDRQYMIQMIIKFRGAQIYTFIQQQSQQGQEKIINGLNNQMHFINGDKMLEISAKLVLIQNAETGKTDGYTVQGGSLKDSNGLLLDENKKIRGIFHVCNEDGITYLNFPGRLLDAALSPGKYYHFSLGFLDEKTSRGLCRYYYGAGPKPAFMKVLTCSVPELDLEVLAASENALVIDFGTTNTAAGTLKNNVFFEPGSLAGIQKVIFNNTLSEKSQGTELIPTVVSIQDCQNPDNISFRFGYDALAYARKYSFTNPQSIFYGLKKWVNSYNHLETIVDEQGYTAQVTRKEILRAYFEYIIDAAQQQMKCIFTSLHITSPVKQKQQYLQMFQDVLADYQIVCDTALDEGVAVLYNTISKQITANSFANGEIYKGLIIDCGGGTTDLTSCNYEIYDSRITYTLNLDTTYANGFSNFGGDNITFRIMQYLKILFSHSYYQEPAPRLEELLDTGDYQTYRYLDEFGHESLYNSFEQLYKKCESIIPTQYECYSKSTWEEYRQVRSNFYFLWYLAEKIKVDFYQDTAIVQTDFHLKGIQKDRPIQKILPQESWRINIYEKSTKEPRLVLHTEFPPVIITKEEINLLIQGDIYSVIKQFLEPILEKDSLENYHFIKLTGQTCKIQLFRDALKEFIPGRLIETAKKAKNVQDFKLSCLEGAIQYQNARHIGLIAPTIVNKAPITPYSLVAHTHRGEEMVLMAILEKINKTYGFVSRNIDTKVVELFLRDSQNKTLHTYHVKTNAAVFQSTTYNEMGSRYQNEILQDDIDNIVDNELKIFTFANEDKWGFFVLPLARVEKRLLIGEELYLPFETEAQDNHFFDGRR